MKWFTEVDLNKQTITQQISHRVFVVVDLVHTTRTIVKDGVALDTCQIGPDIVRYYHWLLRVVEDAQLLDSNTQSHG